MITASKNLLAENIASHSTFIKRYVSTPKNLFPDVSYVFLAVKHLRTGAKQESYTPLLECETLIQFEERSAPADICATALQCQQQKRAAFQHRNLLLLKVEHFISQIYKLASQRKYVKAVQCLFSEYFPVSAFINLRLSSIS